MLRNKYLFRKNVELVRFAGEKHDQVFGTSTVLFPVLYIYLTILYNNEKQLNWNRSDRFLVEEELIKRDRKDFFFKYKTFTD